MGRGGPKWTGRSVACRKPWPGPGLAPVKLRPKEGLALINGTQATTGLGVLALLAAERAAETADACGAMSVEALLGTPQAFREEIQRARPHRHQAVSAARLRALIAGSEIRESHRWGDPRVQDAYSLRCIPQVHGATRSALAYVRGILEVEINSATDNPLVFPQLAWAEAADAAGRAGAESEDAKAGHTDATMDPAGIVVSGGNFHAQIVAQALDLLAIAAADMAAICERRIERMLNPDLSMGLPAFLARRPGLESGFMIVQVVVADLLSEMRVLAHPASVDSVPTALRRGDRRDSRARPFPGGDPRRRPVAGVGPVLPRRAGPFGCRGHHHAIQECRLMTDIAARTVRARGA